MSEHNGFFRRLAHAILLTEWPGQDHDCYGMSFRTAWDIARDLPGPIFPSPIARLRKK